MSQSLEAVQHLFGDIDESVHNVAMGPPSVIVISHLFILFRVELLPERLLRRPDFSFESVKRSGRYRETPLRAI